MRRKFAVLLVGMMLLGGLAGCGDSNDTSSQGADANTTSMEKTENEDQNTVDADTDSETDTDTDTEDSGEFTPEGNITPGVLEGNTYTVDSYGFKLELTDENWEFWDAARIASTMGSEEQEITDFWDGKVSPYDVSIGYCAFAWDQTTGSNIIINYASTEKNFINSDITGREYLEIAASGYPGSTVSDVTFVGDNTYARLDLVQQTAGATQYMYATNRDSIIIMITITVADSDSLDEILAMFSAL